MSRTQAHRAVRLLTAALLLSWLVGVNAATTSLGDTRLANSALWWKALEAGQLAVKSESTLQTRLEIPQGQRGLVQVLLGSQQLTPLPQWEVAKQPGSYHLSETGRLLLNPGEGKDLEEVSRSIVLRQLRPDASRRITVTVTVVGVAIALLVIALLAVEDRTLRLPWSILATLMGFAALHLAASLLPLPAGTDRVGLMLDQLRHELSDVEVVAVGSSRIWRHFDPEVFEAEFPTTKLSYNLGAIAMRMGEAVAISEKVLAMHPPNLRWIIVDSIPGSFQQGNLWTRRVERTSLPSFFFWTVPETLTYVVRRDGATDELRQLLRAHTHHLARTGHAREWITTWRGLEPELIGTRGHNPLSSSMSHREDFDQLLRRRRLFRRGGKQYLRRVERITPMTRGHLVDPTEIALMERLEAAARHHDVRIAFVLPPEPEGQANLLWAKQHGKIKIVLRYDDPARHPELFAIENRWDNGHLNAEGARIFSRLLARDLADHHGEPQ